MRIVLDMNLPPSWVEFLSQHGIEAVHWIDVGDNRASDAEIMRWAAENKRVVFTHDLDFSTLLAVTEANGPSVIQLRTQDVLPDRDSVIVAWSPPQRLALRSQQGGMTAIYEYTCKPEAGGTRVTLDASCHATGLGWRLASPLIQLLMKRTDSGQVAALKQLVESTSI